MTRHRLNTLSFASGASFAQSVNGELRREEEAKRLLPHTCLKQSLHANKNILEVHGSFRVL